MQSWKGKRILNSLWRIDCKKMWRRRRKRFAIPVLTRQKRNRVNVLGKVRFWILDCGSEYKKFALVMTLCETHNKYNKYIELFIVSYKNLNAERSMRSLAKEIVYLTLNVFPSWFIRLSSYRIENVSTQLSAFVLYVHFQNSCTSLCFHTFYAIFQNMH